MINFVVMTSSLVKFELFLEDQNMYKLENNSRNVKLPVVILVLFLPILGWQSSRFKRSFMPFRHPCSHNVLGALH